jgi:hypothetical protein
MPPLAAFAHLLKVFRWLPEDIRRTGCKPRRRRLSVFDGGTRTIASSDGLETKHVGAFPATKSIRISPFKASVAGPSCALILSIDAIGSYRLLKEMPSAISAQTD